MGVDLYAITGHRYSYEQIIQLQERIESDEVLNALYWWSRDAVEPWAKLMTEDRLLEFWEHNEKREEDENGIFFYDDLDLPTFFGSMTFHRNVVCFDGFGMKLWILDDESDLRRDILKFYHRLAEILGQDHVIYYGDSWAKSSWIGGWRYGKTLKEILEAVSRTQAGSIADVGRSVKEDHLYIQRIGMGIMGV